MTGPDRGRRHAWIGGVAVVVAALAPAPAAARTPLVPLRPGAAPVVVAPVPFDRILSAAPRRAPRAHAASDDETTYPAADGTPIHVAVSPSYETSPPALQTYVGFLSRLPHGPELATLHVYLAPPAEVSQRCHGGADVLACYDPSTETMSVPGEAVDSSSGVTTAYVIAHEYGHHLARNRQNAPFTALEVGPKYWASYERTCAGVIEGRFALDDEAGGYSRNPGENWAETYAHLVFPQTPWSFDPLLRPDDEALAAARRDVSTPWPGSRLLELHGTLSPDHRLERRSIALHLDGPLTVRLRGPSSADYDLRLTAHGRLVHATSARGSDDVLRLTAACRDDAAERVTVEVVERRGRGPFTARVTYAG